MSHPTLRFRNYQLEATPAKVNIHHHTILTFKLIFRILNNETDNERNELESEEKDKNKSFEKDEKEEKEADDTIKSVQEILLESDQLLKELQSELKSVETAISVRNIHVVDKGIEDAENGSTTSLSKIEQSAVAHVGSTLSLKTVMVPGDQILAKVEIIIQQDLYHLTLIWRPKTLEALLVARNVIKRNVFKEYQILMDLDMLSNVTGMHVEMVESHLMKNTYKVFQQITHHLRIESIESKFYSDVVALVKPTSLTEFRSSIEEIHRFLPLVVGSNTKSISSNGNKVMELSYGFLLRVLTIRASHGGLIHHSFPIIRSIKNIT